ncbi:neutral zinc metallopeptidase [Mycobacterium sp. 1274761.0]|uniref:neutral zinc metallopeptidase n=1 Tax=Mycobacterium sp. 1274761.0 TaxID=1834077 RepID=UPI0007FED5F5|nr:neutral zinc metallopeptidase [Mycobacterium sp. 1274761.0]OBK76841.1 peptidase [Mycobacterium sp. 1274761.0]
MSRRPTIAAALAVAGVLLVASCSTTVKGTPVSVFDDPFKVAGMPAVDGPTGLRPGAREPSRDVENSDGGEIDELAAASVSDIEDFWATAYPETFDDDFTPVKELISWDATGFERQEFCGEDTYGLVNAGFCFLDNTIGWDRGVLLPSLRDDFGDIAVTNVLAHEYGHAIQHQAMLDKKNTPTLVAEQQADCFAGAYMRWVAEGNSDRFTLSTADGLNSLLASVISIRDPLLSEDEYAPGANEHGSAFERITAFQFGFTDGASSCAAIDAKEIAQRRGDLPVELQQNQTGEWPVSEESVKAIVDALGTLFSPADPPRLSFQTYSGNDCRDARPSPPVSYCPATNTITVDLAGLEAMGAPSGQEGAGAEVTGDNTAYSVLVSRYMLALQHERGGMALDNAEAALRTACLTGVATTKMTDAVTTADGNTVALTAGDLDEAVSGLLTNGLVAGDVNGETVPSGFSRMDAFRTGVLGDEDRCFKRFP